MDNEIIDLLRAVASSFQMRMKEQIVTSDSGLSAFQARLINLIGRNDGISQLTLGSLTERDKGQIARAINELEAGGFVTRSLNASDKRSKCLTLTSAGRKMHIRLNALRGQLAAEALRGLGDDDKHALQATLQKVATRLRPPG
ncbi:Multidrug resistance operon repressor [Pigmentiphaga humi]|uniref:Multidrug resistance operon repressor n=1 Tax=Pigmentiphaga humi TaxID=2478468 RepID=A0A3P4B8Y0_9BURK|nr:MarR family transcriptional regulator [Pigmentiphaga humi]VCU71605.1 Multidrug resistance operon repressor [Pigmentiphaga humi]